MQQTLVLVKPDGIQRCLIGEIIGRYEKKGLKLRAIKMLRVSDEMAHKHYRVHEGRFYYDRLIRYITAAPVIAMVWSGDEAVSIVRSINGSTDPLKSAPGTIRGDYCTGVSMNLVHASDSEETAKTEISLFFEPHEIYDYDMCLAPWMGKPDK